MLKPNRGTLFAAIRREETLSQIPQRCIVANMIADACHYCTQQVQHMVRTLVVPHSLQAFENDFCCPHSTGVLSNAYVALDIAKALADAFGTLNIAESLADAFGALDTAKADIAKTLAVAFGALIAWTALKAPTTICIRKQRVPNLHLALVETGT
jgi:hypothetical protein